MTTKGTREWADSNVNCYYGCSNDCIYCYARNMAFRFKRIEVWDDWKIMKPNQKAIDKGYRKRKGRIMFPTSHDITSESLDTCIGVLKKLLKPGNEVLITTKPYYFSVATMCDVLRPYKKQIQFRFTITSIDDKKLRYFEPGAPTFKDRLRALKLAYQCGFKTSISIEPYLDADLVPLIRELRPYVTDTIWIGIMSNLGHVISRAIWDIQQIPHDPTVKHPQVQEIREMIRDIHAINQDYGIARMLREIMRAFQDTAIYEKLRLKDSIKNKGFEL